MLGYPYVTHNLVRPDMTPFSVPDQAYDEALCDEWWNPNGVVRRGGKKQEPEPAPVEVEKPRRGRPAKGSK